MVFPRKTLTRLPRVAATAVLLAGAIAQAAHASPPSSPVYDSNGRIIQAPFAPGSHARLTKDRALAPLNGDDRPTIAGASLLVFNPTTGEQATLDMPAAGWAQLARGFRYSDPRHARGPVTRALIKSHRLARVAATGSGIAFTLDESHQGSLGAVLTTGGHRYCTLFGGIVRVDAPGRFVATRAPAPPACPAP